jgi:predicted HTH transcriptional regulator
MIKTFIRPMRSDTHRLHFLRRPAPLRKLAKTVVAFANGDGGRIIVGVEDRTRAVIGLAPEQIDDLLDRVPSSLADQILILYNDRRDLTSTDVCRHLNVSRATAVAALSRLTQAGRLRRTGRGPQTRYVMGTDPE